ncbi:MAG: hypothetical protein HUU41_06275 [Bryobacteraceae bacterium]|nr:hypothetical protein [Bryobacterales bacterium]MEB2359704.1 hypothetical protein [Bryobacterales bacterium]NUN00700.1 hypothetical protein [Bryobacteraceae bacterium]
MKNWKLIAEGLDLGIPTSELEKIFPALERLEKDCTVLRGLAPGKEPAITFGCGPDTQ